jgi:FkbM family methyltransferase
MKRFVKRLLHRLVPRWVAHAIRDRIEQRLNAGPVLEVKLERLEPSIRCTVADQYTFLAPLECQRELDFHTRTQEGRAELSGIAEGALRGGTLFDIGAHAGVISALFCAARPENRVYSFEPSPISQKRLAAMRDLNRFNLRMRIEPVAIGREKATMEMLIDPGGGYVQIQHFEHSMWDAPEKIQVPIENIGDAAARLGVIPDFIKLDIESFEYEAIEGARAFLAEHKPELFIELHLNYLEERKLSPKHLVATLVDCGYSFFTYGGTALRASELYDSPLQGIRFVARAPKPALPPPSS